jgi:hypothetical protein
MRFKDYERVEVPTRVRFASPINARKVGKRLKAG